MLQVGLANRGIRRYLIATRGQGAEYLSHNTTFATRFFGDVLESFDSGSIEISDISLVEVDSHRADIEVLHKGEKSFVIFDQSMMDLFGAATGALLADLEIDRVSARGEHKYLLNAFFANRYLSLGFPYDAAWQATLARKARAMERPLLSHERARRDAWVRVQACFSIGHEVMHTRARIRGVGGEPGGVEVLARLLARDYESRMRPISRAMDAADPNLDSKTDRWDSPWGYVPGTEDRMRPQFTGRDLSWEQKLNWIMATPDGFGEEVICDYASAIAVARNLGGKWLTPDEVLVAAYVGLVTRIFLNIVENRILAYTSRAPEDLLTTVAQSERIRTRLEFARLALGPICRRGVAKELRGQPDDAIKAEAATRWESLRDFIRRIDSVWTTPLLRLFVSGGQWSDFDGNAIKVPEIPDEVNIENLVGMRDYCKECLGADLEF